MLKIRFQRIGKKNQPHYRIVVMEHWRKPKGKHIEILGSYDPRSKKTNLKKDRIQHWISVGAKTSPTVHNLLISNKIITGSKIKASKQKKQSLDKKEKDDKMKTKVETQ